MSLFLKNILIIAIVFALVSCSGSSKSSDSGVVNNDTEQTDTTDDTPFCEECSPDLTNYSCECNENGTCYDVNNETEFDAVPWGNLSAGDTVRIHNNGK